MSIQRRLGRGLEALLGRPLHASVDDLIQKPETREMPLSPEQPPEQQDTSEKPDTVERPLVEADSGLVNLPIDRIDSNPFQPRQVFDENEIHELSQSLQQHGMMQPIVVRRADDRFQLISGDRRVRAAQKAGWTDVPAQIRQADDRQLAELALVENLHRKDLGPLEKATSFREYLDRHECTQEELAKRLNIDRSTIANLIRLLELPEPVQNTLRSGAISVGHARAMLPLGDEHEQIAFCKRIQEEALSVRATEKLVRDTIHQADGQTLSVFSGNEQQPKASTKRNEHLGLLEKELRSALGTKVDIRQSTQGRGRIVIHFTNHDEFERIRQFLCHHDESGHAQIKAG